MAEKVADRRTLKTRKAICEALSELLTEKELHKVTVQEIADKADVNRVTFYKHYMDVYDLYEKIEQNTLLEMGLMVLRLEEQPAKDVFKNLAEYIMENKAVFRMMFSPNSTGQLRDKFSKCLEGLFLKMESEKKDIAMDNTALIYKTCYRAQGCVAVLARWVMGGFNEPVDFVVKTLSELDVNIAK